MENNYKIWLKEKLAEKCVTNLKKHRFDAHFFQSSEEALTSIIGMVSKYETFGFGGSDTTRALKIPDELIKMGKTVYDHNREGISPEDSFDFRRKQSSSDCFFCSANAISATGEIVNVDGVGNRTNAMSFGPKKVIIVAGMNKVAHDLDSALKRIREVAGPMRAKSLGMDTPCAKTGICDDCNAPMRICNITTILHRKPMMTDISVVLINEELGY
ncbi:MAG: lactate utilization protein [Desulfobacterales bacterium]|jgi:hypothetical protein|nr:lactate utilization protein [Desulfobacterales bacterium]